MGSVSVEWAEDWPGRLRAELDLPEPGADDELHRLKEAIGEVVAQRDRLKWEMTRWYEGGRRRYPEADRLAAVDALLSELDTRFKALWDAHRGVAGD